MSQKYKKSSNMLIFWDLLSLIITGNTNQLNEVQ